MKTRMVLVAVAVLFGFSLQLAARADTISYVGTQFDTGAGWRTASTNNVYSAGGNTYYGTDGYYAFAMQLFGNNSGNFNPGSAPSGIQDVVAPPAFVTSSGFAPGVQEAGGYNYAFIDNPATTPGGSPTTAKLGIITTGSGPKYSFTVNGTVSSFQLGVMVDGTDQAQFSAGEVSLTDENSQGVTHTIYATGGPTWNGIPDLVFFNVSGVHSGDTFTVSGFADPATGTGVTDAGIDAIFFDKAVGVPEPSSILALSGLAAMGLFVFVRRRRRA